MAYENAIENDMKGEFNPHVPINTLAEAIKIVRAIVINRSLQNTYSVNVVTYRGNTRYRDSKKQRFARNVEAQDSKASAPEPPPAYSKYSYNMSGYNKIKIKGKLSNSPEKEKRLVWYTSYD